MRENIKLGKFQQVDLRDIWEHEAIDFTPWLEKVENLSLLSETIGVEIVLEERESAVGKFSVDLYAKEEGTNRKIIIENQLEATDHDHLGKIITYASGKDAEIIIWIVKEACLEHRQAIKWLNEHTDETFAFFLIEIEVWRIGNSDPAPKFNIVEQPNNWAKEMKVKGSEGISFVQMNFWREFNIYANKTPEFIKRFKKLRKPQAQHWYDLSVGSSAYHLAMTINTQKNILTCGIYIDNDKNIYNKFNLYAKEIEQDLGMGIQWNNSDHRKASRFFVCYHFDINKPEQWNDGIIWLCEMGLKIREIVKKYDIN